MQIDKIVIEEVHFKGADYLRFDANIWYYVSAASGDIRLLSAQACAELEEEYSKNSS